ncbi:TetR family transcriptional regulator [Rhodonellum psychrophilum GCM71 = DSM 17998]|uniref:TetR family transcriptional regulator n=2 Tax=Rhodonellum TaxID=336827 RepID=U5BW07_9BACT|nr:MULTISPECIES: TetR/AcrR family transcriptional regulator [Rhodonellum]ERM82053.1 TetR family transcriptional regulator [Rhodonellum psychrophilum GCM71 = DSM 17998]MDO9554288.1 TetR/AcrR family transcriptional regulator [Rhodonellum sp.]SDZ07684.1 transcriptional regulator, TetR family [Rhodonellum ikkaensis]
MRKKIDIESKILDISYKLFLKQGYKNTTMDDIAQELAMSKKTLYKHFEGKMELLAAAFEQLKTRLTLKVETLVENRHIPFTVKLKSMLTVIANDLAPINHVLLQDLREHAPEIWKELQDYIRESAFLRFQKLIQEGIEKGFVSANVNKSLIVLVYASAIQNLIDPTFLAQFPKEIKENLNLNTADIFDQVINMIYQGILTEDARKELQGA